METLNIEEVMALQMLGMPVSKIRATDLDAFDRLYEHEERLEENIDKANYILDHQQHLGIVSLSCQDATFPKQLLDKYRNYSVIDEIAHNRDRIFALCSTADELLVSTHAEILKGLLPQGQLMVVDDFGHQCKDAGMTHLYDLIVNAIDAKQAN